MRTMKQHKEKVKIPTDTGTAFRVQLGQAQLTVFTTRTVL